MTVLRLLSAVNRSWFLGIIVMDTFLLLPRHRGCSWRHFAVYYHDVVDVKMLKL
jgi:hypothetical protein